jgi:CheY-like chemotaxis protein
MANLDFSTRMHPEISQHHWLVVDDEKNVRDVIGDILFFEKIACDFATDGLDALRKIQKTRYSGMILDIKMPEMDGLQTLNALQTIDPDIPILIITGFDDEQTQKAAENPNVVGILLKPFTGEDIKGHLHKIERKRGR